MSADQLPSVSVLALGGTIASTGAGAGVTPTLTAEQLVESVPGLVDVARIQADTFRQVPSPELTLVDLVALAREIERRIDSGDTGVVVTQGTNTIEETSFVLDLLVDSDAPVVVTGAMRNPTLPGADGPANLLAAVSTAASPHARGLGCLVVFADEIHAARYVRKAHTQSIMPFRSTPVGPIGWVSERAVRIGAHPVGRRHLRLDEISEAPPVALLTFGSGDEGLLAAAVAPAGYRGLVVEATGGGHVTARSVEELERLASQMPVVLASRTAAGELLSRTYSFVGSEVDLAERGLINARAMTAARARLLLRLLLAAEATVEEVRQAFAALGAPGEPAELLGGRLTVSA
ncbi:MAG: asparaginase [Solirubrobacteraceae bacterium]